MNKHRSSIPSAFPPPAEAHRQLHARPARPFVLSCIALAAVTLLAQGTHAATSITHVTSYTYDSNGFLTVETVEPDVPDLCGTTIHTPDRFGNRRASSTNPCPGVSAAATFQPRNTWTDFTADGALPQTNWNPLNQQQNLTYDATYGNLVREQGPNGLTSEYGYDELGRKVIQKATDGTGRTFYYSFFVPFNYPAAGMGPPETHLCVEETPVGGPIDVNAKTSGGQIGPKSWKYYNTYGQLIRSITQGYDGNGPAPYVTQDFKYDIAGRRVKTSRPYILGSGTIYWTTFEYDRLGRVTKVINPDNGTTNVTFAGLTTTIQDERGYSSKQILNWAGQVISVVDANQKTLTYQYDPAGNTTLIQDSAGNQLISRFDKRGRKWQTVEPNSGTTTQTFDALGALKTITDNKGQVTTFNYDLLGRLFSRTSPSGNSGWTYDTCYQGVGKLCSVSGPGGFAKIITYDSLGRPQGVTSYIPGGYNNQVTYTANGMVDTIIYPSGLGLKNNYTPLGYLKSIAHKDQQAYLYWRADSVDASFNVTQQTLGPSSPSPVGTLDTYFPTSGRLQSRQAWKSGSPTYDVMNASYSYDQAGNLTNYYDTVSEGPVSFGYDALGRMTSENRGGNVVTYGYNDVGNLTSRTDIGTFNYPLPGTPKPHAVSSVTGVINGVANPSFIYDANGNFTSGGGYTATWNSFNQADSVSRSINGNTVTDEFLYDAENGRAVETNKLNGVVQRTTRYIHPAMGRGLFYEEEVTPAGTTRKHYLSVNGKPFGVLIQRPNGTWVEQYWQPDLASSVKAVTEGGNVSERLQYEPFGKRRLPGGGTDASGTMVAATDRGFGNHEMMDEVGLINMNGRIYHPALGRFLSPDPVITDNQNLQAFNRYSYAGNNPWAAGDPSGYFKLNFIEDSLRDALNPSSYDRAFRKFVAWQGSPGNLRKGFLFLQQMPGASAIDQAVVSDRKLYMLGQTLATAFTTMWCGGCGGVFWSAYYSYYTTGSLNASAKSAAITYYSSLASEYISNSGYSVPVQVVAGAAVNGAASYASGGTFADGFKSGLKFGLVRAGANSAYNWVVADANADLPNEYPTAQTATSNGVQKVQYWDDDGQPLPGSRWAWGNGGPSNVGTVETNGTGSEINSWVLNAGAKNVPMLNSLSILHDSFQPLVFKLGFSWGEGFWSLNTATAALSTIITTEGVTNNPGAVASWTVLKNQQKRKR